MNIRRPVTWLMVVMLFTITGVALGSLLDWLFGRVSFDYIYRAGHFLWATTKVSLVLGTITAASATVGSSAPAPPTKAMTTWLVTLTFALLVGLLTGLLSAGFSKWLVTESRAAALAPRTRLWVCEGTWVGTLAGALAANGLCNFRLLRSRVQSRHT